MAKVDLGPKPLSNLATHSKSLMNNTQGLVLCSPLRSQVSKQLYIAGRRSAGFKFLTDILVSYTSIHGEVRVVSLLNCVC